MTLWRRPYQCKACGHVMLRTLSRAIDGRTPCPMCGARDGWKARPIVRLACAVEGCTEDARCGSGLCLRHEIRARRLKR